MSKKRGLAKGARFCPFCGVESLHRDDYSKTHGKRSKYGNRPRYEYSPPEFVCRTCNAAFKLSPSMRLHHANTIAAMQRKLRPPEDDMAKAIHALSPIYDKLKSEE